MSDKLLERIAVALEAIAASKTTAPVQAQAGAVPPKSAATGAKPAADAKAAKPAATAAKPAATAAKPATDAKAAKPAAAPKQVGKYSLDDVRKVIREVSTHEALGKQEAFDILDENANVAEVRLLKPEDYDKVYEACVAALNSAGGGGSDDETAPAGEEFDPLS